MKITTTLVIALLGIIIVGCHSMKQPINISKDISLSNNRSVLKNYLNNNQISNGELYDVNKQRNDIINSLQYSELISDTLIIYETIFSHITTSYNCIVYNSRLKTIRYFTEKSQVRLTEDGIKLEDVTNPPHVYICLINTIREKGIYKWNNLKLPNIGSTRYSMLTIAVKNLDNAYNLTSYVDIYPPLECQ